MFIVFFTSKDIKFHFTISIELIDQYKSNNLKKAETDYGWGALIIILPKFLAWTAKMKRLYQRFEKWFIPPLVEGLRLRYNFCICENKQEMFKYFRFISIYLSVVTIKHFVTNILRTVLAKNIFIPRSTDRC